MAYPAVTATNVFLQESAATVFGELHDDEASAGYNSMLSADTALPLMTMNCLLVNVLFCMVCLPGLRKGGQHCNTAEEPRQAA